MPLLTTLALAPALALLQDPAPAAAPEPRRNRPEPLISLWVDDLPGLMPSPKDAGLVAALSMLDERLIDLIAEMGEEAPPIPAPVVRAASRMFMGRKSLRVFESTDPDAMLPFYLQLEVQQNDPGSAQRMADALFSFAQDMGMPLSDAGPDGRRVLEMPDMPPMHMGLVGPNFVVSMGGSAPVPGRPSKGGLPSEVRPAMSMTVDVGRMVEMGLAFLEMQAPPEEVEYLATTLDTYGLTNMRMELAMGSDAERSYSVLRMPGYGATLRAMHMVPERGLTAEDFRIVPADALWAQLTTFDAVGMYDYVAELSRNEALRTGFEDDDVLPQIERELGIDLRADVAAHLGDTFAFYTSDTTGGGGSLSAVAVVELVDRDGMLATLNRLRGRLDGLGAEEADGYVRVHGWKHGADDLMSLTFPGLPVPLEVTVAVGERHMVAGLTPQAALGALWQLRNPGAGLLDRQDFRAQLSGDPVGAYGVQFMDTPRLAREGYGIMSLATSALANVMRSPSSRRDPGVVMPSYPELMAGAKPLVTVSRIEGEDYLEVAQGDPSMLVNGAGLVGMVMSSPIALLVGAGVAGAVAEQSRGAAPFPFDDFGPGFEDESWDEDSWDEEYWEEEYSEDESWEEEEVETVEEPLVEEPAAGGGGR